MQEKKILLTGNDCYALRCSLLHEDRNNLSAQEKKKALERFKFLVPPKGIIIHKYSRDESLQLQVDLFCRDVIEGIEKWEEHIKDKKQIQEKIKNLLMIVFLEDTALSL